MTDSMTFLPYGEQTVLIQVHKDSLQAACGQVASIMKAFEHHREDYITEIVPAFDSVMVKYDFRAISFDTLVEALTVNLSNLTDNEVAGKQYQLPICYDGVYAPDMEIVCQQTGLSVDEVIDQHLQTNFTVMMTGFMPGFAYLGELPETLAVARKTVPRVRVEAGSVGLAGRMTGIYSTDSPGGWQIIGKSINLLQFQLDQDIRLSTGDHISFHRVSATEFQNNPYS